MVNKELVEYIKQAKLAGHAEDTIKQALVLQGWQDSDIVQAFALEKLGSMAPAPSVPVPPAPAQVSTEPMRPIIVTPQVQRPVIVARPKRPQINSPLSVLLAIILFFSLLTLVNRIISDINSNVADVSSRLALDAFVVVPFLLIAFLIHYSFSQDNKKFLIISQPYDLVAGWLVVRLLFYVSQFILDKNSTYGVYIVLILIIAALTGIVVFVQRIVRK